MSGQPSSEQSVFFEALEIESEPARQEYLNRACGNDAALRTAVEALFAAHHRLKPIGADSAGPRQRGDGTESISERPGTVIGPYKLIEQIGTGGFGIVFLAEQQEPVRRKVALKIIKPGMDTRQVIARFEAERQALALMDHPHIARVLDGGETGTGRPYFVMELIRGVPITEYCDRHQLNLPARLKLFMDVCRAVGHAHQKGIIHRDIKPANVLVTLIDGAPVAKVIDFGVAKATGQQLTDKTLHTGFRQMIGSPLYMSPEQAEMSGQDIDTRADLYALGVLLYELLTGATPFDRERLTSLGFDEICRIIREEDPPKPSTRISTLGQAISTVSMNRGTDPRQLAPLLRGDLDWIVMKCLEKDRTRRYETANNLCRDVERFLNDEPIEARPPSMTYRVRKFLRRHTFPLTMVFLLVMAIGLGGAISIWQALRAASANEAEVQAKLTLSDTQQRAAEERANTMARELELLNKANSLIESGRFHAQFGEWVKSESSPNWTKADSDFTKAVELRPNHSHVWSARGDFYVRLGLWDMAAADLKKAVELREPESATAWYFHALLCLYVGDTAAYQSACRRMAARFSDSDNGLSLDETARTCLLTPDPVVDRAKLLQLAERALEVGKTPWRITNLGTAHLRLGQNDKAMQRVLESQAADGKWDPVWNNSILAMAFHRLGETQLARKSLDAATKAHDQHVNAIVRGAPGGLAGGWWNILQSTLHYREARKLIEGSEPRDDPRQWVIRGKALAALNRHDPAIACFTKAIDMDPTLSRAWESRAIIHLQRGNWEMALADLEKTRTLNLKSAAALNNLAWVLATCPAERFRDPPRAVTLAEQAVTLAPNNASYRNTLGVARYRTNDWKGAADSILKSINLLKGGHRVDWYFMAMSHWRMGQKDSARRWFAHAQQRMFQSVALDEEVVRFRAEAAALLGLPEKWTGGPPTPLDDAAFYTLILETDPSAGWVYTKRGAVRADLKQFELAAADFGQAIEQQPKDSALWYQQAAACLGADDLAGYQKVRAGILKNFGDTKSPSVASNLLYISVMAPAQKEERRTLILMARQAMEAAPHSQRILSAALYRNGQYADALRNLEDVARLFPPRAWDWLFLAMIHHKLGHAEEARQNLNKAVKWIEQANRQPTAATEIHWFGWSEQVEVNQLRREAEALIEGAEPPLPKP